MRLKRPVGLSFHWRHKQDIEKTKKDTSFSRHESRDTNIVPAENRQQAQDCSRGQDERDNTEAEGQWTNSIAGRQNEEISFVSKEEAYQDREDEEITFGEPSKFHANVGQTKKKLGVFASLKQRLTKNKTNKEQKEAFPTIFIEVCSEEAGQYEPAEQFQPPEPDTPSSTTWEKFMDTVAFPEKHLEEPYQQFVDYVTAHTMNCSSQPFVSNSGCNPYEYYIEKLEKPASASTTKSFASSLQHFESALSEPDIASKDTCGDQRVDSVSPRTDSKVQSNGQLVVTMYKNQDDERLGIGVETINGKEGIYISQLIDGSISASTKLEAGMRILSINNKPCPSTARETIHVVSCIKGAITLRVAPAEPVSPLVSGYNFANTVFGCATEFLMPDVAAVQEEKSVDSVESYGDEDNFTIANDATLASTTCDGDGTAFENVAQTTGCDSGIRAYDPVEAARSGLTRNYGRTFRIEKRMGDPAGMWLMKDMDWPGIYVDGVDSKGKFATTQLRSGMKIIGINGCPCPTELDEAIDIISDTNGVLELTVEDERGLTCRDHGYVKRQDNILPNTPEKVGGVLVTSLRLGQ
eukprot:scaffold6299_cov107-Cylindrotheca_fusiformis.AAC.11